LPLGSRNSVKFSVLWTCRGVREHMLVPAPPFQIGVLGWIHHHRSSLMLTVDGD
jgi:hypothetical protein